MVPGLVSEVFLIDPPEHLTLVLHGLLWYFPNSQATQGGGVLNLLGFLGVITLLDNLRRYLKGHGSACGAKPGAPYIPFPNFPWLTTA